MHKRRERRPRRYITSESLASHPVVELFDRKDVQEILRKTNRNGLSFSEIQYLLCDEEPAPKTPKTCPKKTDCAECSMIDNCRKARFAMWSAVKTRIGKPIYVRRSNLADDLHRFCEEHYLHPPDERGCYTRGERKGSKVDAYALSSRKRKLLEEMNRQFPDEVRIVNGRSVIVGAKDGDADEVLKELDSHIQAIEEGLLLLTVREALRQVSKRFLREVAATNDKADKVRLQGYLMDHISLRLASWGLDEIEFEAELLRIREHPLGLTAAERLEAESALSKEAEAVRGPKIEVSKAYWLQGDRGKPGNVYIKLMMEPLLKIMKEDADDLTEGQVGDDMCMLFQKKGAFLSKKAKACVLDYDTWLIKDEEHEYVVVRAGGRLQVYRARDDVEMNVRTIIDVKTILDRESNFAKRFEEVGLDLSLDLKKWTPMIVIGFADRSDDSMGKGPRLSGKPGPSLNDEIDL